MTPRSYDIEIPPDEPFLNDVLERKESVTFLANLIEATGGPFVFAVDAPWGNGKTTFVRLLRQVLENKGFQSLYFNAWKFDYVTDPLIAMVSVLNDIDPEDPRLSVRFKEKLKILGQITSHITRRASVLVVKGLTAGLVDTQVEAELLGEELSDTPMGNVVDAFQDEAKNLNLFREALEAAVDQFTDSENSKPLVFFIDELDRCRPNFSVHLLERVKHLFDVKNIIFVLSIDKSQLMISTAAVYGTGIDAQEYLRRFIDIEFGIPKPKSLAHTKYLLAKSGLDPIFELRTGIRSEDRRDFITAFSELADVFGITLRARESCMLRMKIVMDQTQHNQLLDPMFVALLIILREVSPKKFAAVCSGQAAPDDVTDFIRGFPGGDAFLSGESGKFIEAYLIAYDVNSDRSTQTENRLQLVASTETAAEADRQVARDRLFLVRAVRDPRYGRVTLEFLSSKIDLAARIP